MTRPSAARWPGVCALGAAAFALVACLDFDRAKSECHAPGGRCVTESLGGTDGGTDAGTDGGALDAGEDAGGPQDAGVDAGIDAGRDGGEDGGADAGGWWTREWDGGTSCLSSYPAGVNSSVSMTWFANPAPLGPPVHELGSAETLPSVSSDQSKLCFMRNSSAGIGTVYCSIVSAGTFGAPVAQTGLGTQQVLSAELYPDGRAIWFTQVDNALSAVNLYAARLVDPAQPQYGEPVLVTGLPVYPDGGVNAFPTFDCTGTHVYFISAPFLGSGVVAQPHLYSATLTSLASVTQPTPEPELEPNPNFESDQVAVSPDGQTAFVIQYDPTLSESDLWRLDNPTGAWTRHGTTPDYARVSGVSVAGDYTLYLSTTTTFPDGGVSTEIGTVRPNTP